jgi:hypothetical protein
MSISLSSETLDASAKTGVWLMEIEAHSEGKMVKRVLQEAPGTETVISQRQSVDLGETYNSLSNQHQR